MSLAVVTLKKGEGRTLKAGGAWVFDNEIANILGSYENGDIVLVHDFDGYPMGRGFINEHSKIRIRMMTRHQDQEIDEAFLRMRVKDAWEYRKKTVDTSSCRLIFGEADFLPGFVVDKFSDVIVVQSLALGIDRMKENRGAPHQGSAGGGRHDHPRRLRAKRCQRARKRRYGEAKRLYRTGV